LRWWNLFVLSRRPGSLSCCYRFLVKRSAIIGKRYHVRLCGSIRMTDDGEKQGPAEFEVGSYGVCWKISHCHVSEFVGYPAIMLLERASTIIFKSLMMFCNHVFSQPANSLHWSMYRQVSPVSPCQVCKCNLLVLVLQLNNT
jgi:hypothetical protein